MQTVTLKDQDWTSPSRCLSRHPDIRNALLYCLVSSVEEETLYLNFRYEKDYLTLTCKAFNKVVRVWLDNR